MQSSKIRSVIPYLILILVILIPRLPALDRFVTLDEPSWLSQGANFYYAIAQREFENTVYEYQPAVTTMWIISLAMLTYFPEYRALEQGYLNYEKGTLDPFMLSHGKDPLALLETSRLIQVFIILVLFLVLYHLLQRLIPKTTALFAVSFASLDPFHLSQSRLMDHEAMVSLFVTISLMALLIHLQQERKLIWLLISGAAAGFAQLTKSSAIAILIPAGVLLLWELTSNRIDGFLKGLLSAIKIFSIWMAALAVTYVVFWPGMWVAPGKMLYEVYGNAFSYALQGSRLKVTGELNAAEFGLNSNLLGIWEVAFIMIRRFTPWTWIGFMLSFSLLFASDPASVRSRRSLFTVFLTTAAAFILLIGIAQGRNSPHYILTSYLALNLLAGLGWLHAVEWLSIRLGTRNFRQAAASLALLPFALQAWSAASAFPYYFTYQNPLIADQPFPQFPYGEGLELAAEYLSSLPGASESTVLSYYGRGCFSYYFPGETVFFRPFWIDGDHGPDLINAIQSADYLVVYQANQGAMEKYAGYLSILSTVKPIHEVWLDGMQYVIIYRVDDFSREIYTALGDL